MKRYREKGLSQYFAIPTLQTLHAYFGSNKLETRFQRTESKDPNDIIFIAKTLRHCTFPLFKLQQP